MANGATIVTDRLTLKNGGRFDIWVSKADMIGRFIKDYKLKPLDMRHLVVHAASLAEVTQVPSQTAAAPVAMSGKSAAAPAEIQWRWPWPWPFPGGLKIPHLHYAGDVYLVNEEQWQEFAKKIITEFSEKLARVQVIGFNPLMEYTEVVGGIG